MLFRSFIINGGDYNTEDGTCIRDYIHVSDLASAHVLALKRNLNQNSLEIFNLGTGRGYSVKELIETVSSVTGNTLTYSIGPRRAGDQSKLVADPTFAKKILGWKPNYKSIEMIIDHAWKWHKKN